MRKDEADVGECRERTRKEQIRYRPSRVLRNLRNHRRNIWQQWSTAERRRRMHEHDGSSTIEFFEDGTKDGVAEPLLAIPCEQTTLAAVIRSRFSLR
jgi:hypothetical protein